jgi:dimeric dUTPase (all-alpha-NTP-PPase superfamily)
MTNDTPTFTTNEIFADRLEEMLRLQEQLQVRHLFGLKPGDLRHAERAEYIRAMILATTDELHEALREVAWKPWSKRPVGEMNRQNFVDELVDAWHFFMNLMLVGEITADEFFTAYLRKNNINHGRIDDGYVSPTG